MPNIRFVVMTIKCDVLMTVHKLLSLINLITWKSFINMTRKFTTEDHKNMYLILTRNHGNVSRTVTLFAREFPNRPRPSRQTIIRVKNRFDETGNVAEKKRSGRRRTATNEERQIDILASVQVQPRLSLRQRAMESATSATSIYRIFKKNKINCYRSRFVQTLFDSDPQRRIDFCRWVRGMYFIQVLIIFIFHKLKLF